MRNGVLIAVLSLTLVACAGHPEDAAPAKAAVGQSPAPGGGARTLPIPSVGKAPADSSTGGAGPMTWNVPATWATVPPANTMRQAQYDVPGSAGKAECVVFYFGPGQGGDAVANAQRWAGQFSQPDGSNSLDKMTMRELDGAALVLRLVEVTGTYDGGMSTGRAAPQPQPGWMLLGGIAEGPDAPWFFKFTGPRATVEENREAFVALLRSIRQEI